MQAHFILFVEDQERSTSFYSTLLGIAPRLNLPGMTEFELRDGCILGLMPEKGIAKIISGPLPHPERAHGIPRCELYMVVDDPEASLSRAIRAGARTVDAVSKRDWGHTVAYFSDPDGHVIALAWTNE